MFELSEFPSLWCSGYGVNIPLLMAFDKIPIHLFIASNAKLRNFPLCPIVMPKTKLYLSKRNISGDKLAF